MGLESEQLRDLKQPIICKKMIGMCDRLIIFQQAVVLGEDVKNAEKKIHALIDDYADHCSRSLIVLYQ